MTPGERSTAEPESPVGVPGGDQGSVEPASKARRRGRFLIETLVIIVIAALVAVGLRTFVVQTFYVPSASMEPTIMIGDRILVDKLSYHFHAVHRGDIVVFSTPPGENCGGPPVPDLVKRVIGLPGDHLSSRGNTVYVNGHPLAEPWLPRGQPLGRPITPITVPKGDYYVMGDNRPYSCDSRYWGPVPGSLIVGKVVAIFWPLSRFHWF